MGYQVKPGTQLAEVISAMPGGMAENLLLTMTLSKGREVMRREHKPRPLREATPWKQDGCKFSVVTITAPEEKRSVTLKLGVREGVFLEDDAGAKKFSLKLVPGVDGELVIPVPQTIQPKRIKELACHVLMMVIRGTEWHDRNGQLHKSPCA